MHWGAAAAGTLNPTRPAHHCTTPHLAAVFYYSTINKELLTATPEKTQIWASRNRLFQLFHLMLRLRCLSVAFSAVDSHRLLLPACKRYLNQRRLFVKKMGKWGMFIEGGDAESPDYYGPGGFHPVHINDSLGDYRVLKKLGHGSFATVWLGISKK
jgi:hypothetical protein